MCLCSCALCLSGFAGHLLPDARRFDLPDLPGNRSTIFYSANFEIAEASAIHGAGEWRTIFQVMLPMAKPGLASVGIFNFLGLWNQDSIPVAINTKKENYVLSQGIAAFAGQMGYAVNFGALFAATVVVIVPVLIAYVFFQRQLQGSVSAGTMK